MCISLPAKICAIDGQAAEVESHQFRRNVLLAVEGARLGDWVLIHGGIAVAILSAREAQETLELVGKLVKPSEDGKR
jgi:hydrogenase expression/formation protein HypC